MVYGHDYAFFIIFSGQTEKERSFTMSENKIINEVIVDNKLKKIYMEFDSYQELNEAEQNFFDQIFNILWFDDKIEHHNKYLAERLGYSVSTIEKRFRKLDNVKLIYRELYRTKNPVNGKWETNRTIKLDPFVRSEIARKLKLIPSDLKMEEQQPSSEPVIEAKEEPVTEVIEKKPKNKTGFNFGKVNK